MSIAPSTDDPIFSFPSRGNPDDVTKKVNAPKQEKPETPKKRPTLTYVLIGAVVLVGILIGLFAFTGGGNNPESTPTQNSLPPGFPTATATPLFGLPPTATNANLPPGFGNGNTNSATPNNTTAGKFAVVCYSVGGQCPAPSNSAQPFANTNEYLDKHVGSPNSTINSLDPGFVNGTYGKITEVRTGATEDKGLPYSYNNNILNHGEPSSACLFQPVDKATGSNIGQPAWVACGGLIIQ